MAVAVERANRKVVATLTDSRWTLLEHLAETKFSGTISQAVGYLIDLYAGHATEQAEQAAADAERYEARRFRAGKLTAELVGYIAGLVRAGLPDDRAFHLSGVSKRQQTAWMKKGRKDIAEGRESVAADLVATLERASAETMLDDVKLYRQTMRANPQAIMSWLERRYPDDFGKRSRSDINVTHSVVAMIDWDRYTLAQARTLVELLRIGTPEPEDGSLSRNHRPVAELLPPDLVETVDLAPGDVEEITEAPDLEAPALDEKPQR